MYCGLNLGKNLSPYCFTKKISVIVLQILRTTRFSNRKLCEDGTLYLKRFDCSKKKNF